LDERENSTERVLLEIGARKEGGIYEKGVRGDREDMWNGPQRVARP